MDLSGDGFLQVTIPHRGGGHWGSGRQFRHDLRSDGGLVQLSAAAAKEMARQAINMSGTIEAKTVGGTSGDVVLAGSNGEVEVSGKIDATGDDGAGGAITVTGRDITLTGANPRRLGHQRTAAPSRSAATVRARARSSMPTR